MKKFIITLCLSSLLGMPITASGYLIEPLRDKVESFIAEWWNVPYVYGGNSKRGIDCSAFTQRFYREIFGLKIPRTAREQFKFTNRIAKDSLQLGDLVFFSSKRSPSGWHVGVYLDSNRFVHAANRQDDVKISSLSDSNYNKSYKGAGRLN